MTPADRAALVWAVKDAEGCRLKAYQDNRGIWTIGYGVNLQELTIDQSTADRWLNERLIQAETEAMRQPWWARLSGNRQAVIVELIYNMGLPRLLGFVQMISAIEAGDFGRAADELQASRWAKQVQKSRVVRLVEAMRVG